MLASRSFTLSISRRAFSTSARRLDFFEKVSAETFAKEVANADKGKLTLVDFYADWCGPCKMLKPVLKKVEASPNFDIDLVTVDIEEQEALAAQYKIRNLPTVIAFRNGKEVDKFMGAPPPKAVQEFVQKNLASQ